MDNFYVACDLGADSGRVSLGSLHKGRLTLCEIRRFPNKPIQEKNSLQWDIPGLYHEVIEGLRSIGAHEEPIDSISCNAWNSDYMLFESDGTLITPTYHHSDPRSEAGMKEVLSRIPWETVYDETGVQKNRASTLFQLAVEKSKRLHRNHRLMPVADGFNYLLAGVPRVEMSSASTTQLYNPQTKSWSERLIEALRLPLELFPEVVPAGTKLGALRPEIARETGVENPQVISSCSNEIAAALVGLPVIKGEAWAYLQTGPHAVLGTELLNPLINDVTREWKFTNELGFGGAVRFSKQLPGLWILDECRQYWRERDREIDGDLLMHLATSSEPFECLVNFSDPRFETPGDMVQKIQAFCRETGQHVPRKPGPVTRCILESLALLYRKTLNELSCVTGRDFSRLYILGEKGNSLLHHFTANALQIPVFIAPPNVTAIGNIVVQALALGHIASIEEARDIVRSSFKMETIMPHAAAWDAAYARLAELVPVEQSNA
ncbi:MAG TPA: rhamnulokinase [Verrucomicrobia bacterium]|nr:rhamnulokinase [Verrucomicrobiota bacterium]HOP96248.1 FGGY family carbohydrate kinase [Verrucomicrobiota bacterium]HPU55665.1 FGGY family carbohydrate kinase [Verrucomicrobiota bacterium]